jgi:regulator of replication initiation timing
MHIYRKIQDLQADLSSSTQQSAKLREEKDRLRKDAEKERENTNTIRNFSKKNQNLNTNYNLKKKIFMDASNLWSTVATHVAGDLT